MNILTVLHVEDDLDAAFFLKRALKKSKLEIDLKQLRDGQEAIDYLDDANLNQDRSQYPLPEIILLDLKMPLKDGFDVLTWIREKDGLNSIPVIVLTSSDREEDLQRAKSLGAASYLTKTVTFGNVVAALEEFQKKRSSA